MNYEMLIKQFKSLIEGENDPIANAGNLSALVFNNLENINWAGFYFSADNELLLSTFQGKPACVRIPLGKGVCGTSAQERKTIIVDNVHNFEGHIACDSASNSEIVVPIIFDGHLFGVFDIDSPVFNRFKSDEEYLFEELIKIYVSNSDMQRIGKYYRF